MSETEEKKTEAQDETEEQPADQTDKTPSNWERFKAVWSAYYVGHRNTVFFGVIGFIIALLLLIIGFWRTLLFAVLVLVGVAYGQYRDGNPRIATFFANLFSKH